jgi:hypothetical protein
MATAFIHIRALVDYDVMNGKYTNSRDVYINTNDIASIEQYQPDAVKFDPKKFYTLIRLSKSDISYVTDTSIENIFDDIEAEENEKKIDATDITKIAESLESIYTAIDDDICAKLDEIIDTI